MRTQTLLVAALALPLLAGPKDAGFVDTFDTEQVANRRLLRGDWNVSDGATNL